MAQCERSKCPNVATKILSVGSLGLVERLCPLHLDAATRPLEQNLVPFELTGIDKTYSAEEALTVDLQEHKNEIEQLHARIDDHVRENQALRAQLAQTRALHIADLHARVEELQAEHAELSEQSPTRVDG